MKYALIPILNKLDEWMKANKLANLKLDEFMDHVSDSVVADDCAEWLWEIYNANKSHITIIEPCPEEKAIREIQS